ncbi:MULTISPECIES: UvrD-helicase domain-containing protein [Agrobacterium]|uniref:DNA 3'-5' helicase II n=1 Tax=Agrobacterium rosae TaxID=1972867 RepID=A0A1R3U795_9HYPH|nr:MULTISPECIES: UvrD-helicase domain-containing protein [Agrobacterium]SCX22507.1 Helicase IV [Agrobacterium sp. DSM 25558]SCX35341.1 Helicase IV [Agrobacterium rosae]
MIFNRNTTCRPGLFARLLPSGRWKLRLPTATAGSAELHTGTWVELPCLDITAIAIKKALLLHTVEIRTRSHVETLSCLGEEAASRLANDLHRFINRYLLELIKSDQEILKEVDAKLEPLIEGKRQYLAQADLAQAIASVSGPAAAALPHPLFDADGITAAMEANLPRSLSFLTDPDGCHRYNNEFVAIELTRYAPFFDDLDGRSLSDQQREFCIRLEDSNLLIASVGSGKSATMVGKVAYVLDKGLYQPEEILVLAYNRTAAEELKERIAHQLGVLPADLQCKVTTFHALGWDIIKLVEARPPQLANWVDHPAGEARVISKIIEDLMQSDASFAKVWIELLVLYPKADIPASVFDSACLRIDISRALDTLVPVQPTDLYFWNSIYKPL